MSVSLASTICVLNFYYRGHNLTKLPGWIKIFLLMRVTNSNLNESNKMINKPTHRLPAKNGLARSVRILKPNLDNFIYLNKELNVYASRNELSPVNLANQLTKINQSTKPNSNVRSLKIVSKDDRIKKMLQIVKTCSNLIHIEQQEEKHNQEILLEWKVAARRLDNILFVVSMAIVNLTPLVLFSKYFIQNNSRSVNSTCGCSYLKS